MFIIKNTTDSVKVLKAVGMPTLRLLPGFNYVDAKNPDLYVGGNPAAKGLFTEKILIAQDADGLTLEEKKEAERAKEKNDLLNKAQKIIKGNEKQIDKQSEIISAQEKTIADLLKRVEAMEEKGGKGKEKTKDKEVK